MDFDQTVAAFQRKKKSQDIGARKREEYLAMLKDYNSMKYAPAVAGQRREREITQEVIDKRAEEKKAVQIDTITESLIGFVDLDLGLDQPKKGKRK